MIDTLIKNIHIATMDAQRPAPYGEFRDAAVGITEDCICWLGTNDAAREIQAKQIYDGQQQWLTPGLIDCHSHLVYGGNRAAEFELKLAGASYQEIAQRGGGIVSTVTQTRQSNASSLFTSSAHRLEKLLAEGVTTIEIKSGYGLNLADEIKMLQVARQLGDSYPVTITTSFLGAHALPAEYDNKATYIQFLIEQVLPKISALGLADAADFFCEGIGFSTDLCRQYALAAIQHGLPVKGHVEQLSYLGGARLVADLNGLSVDHLEYLPETDVAHLKQANVVAVLLPGAFYTLSETQLPPIDAMLAADLPIAIGTDLNPGSSPIASLLNIMNLGCILYKLTPETILRAVTCNAAQALGLHHEIGQIKIGFRADLVLWPVDTPAELCYGMNLITPSRIYKNGINHHVN
ncbi:MAG: imidazolonepropionase [Pseudomonadales bacterium]|nr:imidazolonepropionase [Pseudomonadales bacterium]